MKCNKQIIIGTVVLAGLMLFATKSMATNAIVNTETLNLRKEASTESDIVSLLNMGDKLEIIEQSNEWYKVKINNKTGYVHKDYIKVEESEEQNANTNTTIDESVQNTNTTIHDESEQVTTPEIEENQDNSNEDHNVEQENETEYIEQDNATIKENANCYILPLINSNILANLKKDTQVTIINKVNGWAYIQTEEINGWILLTALDIKQTQQTNNSEEETKEDNTQEQTQTENTTTQNDNTIKEDVKNEKQEVAIEEKNMYVNTASIYMRKGPGTNYEVVDSLILNSGVIVTGEVEDWYKVKVSGKTGYIAKRLLSDKKIEDSTSRSSEERKTDTTDLQTSKQNETEKEEVKNISKGQEIVNYAKQFLGCRYVYGGSGPSTFDCSGFTMYVYKHFGVSLSHSATAQSKKGSYVAKEKLEPGDLVFFKDYETMEGIGHCGIYIGERKLYTCIIRSRILCKNFNINIR